MNQETFDRALNFLNDDERGLADSALRLFNRELSLDSNLTDYSFIVFPMSKAYEGFLKRYLFQLGLIDQKVYEGKKFRIGRALNPDVGQDQRDKYWLYDNVVDACGDEIARQMWDAWLECRNRVFHYFPKNSKSLNLEQAGKRLLQLAQTIEAAGVCQRMKS